MSWILVIAAALVLANLAVAARASRRAHARAGSDEARLREAIAHRRAEERRREG